MTTAATKTTAALLAAFVLSDAVEKWDRPKEQLRSVLYLTRWTLALTVVALAMPLPAPVVATALALNAVTVGVHAAIAKPGDAAPWPAESLCHGGSAAALILAVAVGTVPEPARPLAAAGLTAAVLRLSYEAERAYARETGELLYDASSNNALGRGVVLPLAGAAIAAFVAS